MQRLPVKYLATPTHSQTVDFLVCVLRNSYPDTQSRNKHKYIVRSYHTNNLDIRTE